MVAGGNKTYTCKACGRKFIGWASAVRVFCSRKCSDTEAATRARKHGGSYDRLHQIWCHMKTRCTCPTVKPYSYYGGRGIRVCEEWMASYEAFRDWAMANGYSDRLEIDRIDVNGHYEPSNCRWATRREQMRNTRKRRDAKTSKFKGVSWCANVSKWRTQYCTNGRVVHVGLYRTQIEAALAYDDAVFDMFGQFARINFTERKVPRRKEVSHLSA